MKHNERSIVVLRVLGVNVDVANGALENADLGTVAAGFENQSFILYADDLADDATDGSDLIADDQIVAHGVDFPLLFLLRSEHQEIENGKKRDGQEQGEPVHSCVGSLCFKQSKHLSVFPPMFFYHYTPSCSRKQHVFVNFFAMSGFFAQFLILFKKSVSSVEI